MVKATPAKLSFLQARVSAGLWLRSVPPVIFLIWVLLSNSAKAQITQGTGSQADSPASVQGRVLNRVTHEPISRALVYSPDQRYAMLTDDRGRFEFKISQPATQAKDGLTATTDNRPPSSRQIEMLLNLGPQQLFARKPGFLDSSNDPTPGRVTPNQSEIVIYLDPEALIVGHVSLPGSEGDMRINVNLYRRQIREGEGHWESVRTARTWADGEFRFSELAAGTYKLGTSEELDRDPLASTPGGQLYGFPPIFYPGASDMSTASAIALATGATFQANLSPVRREYYPIRIPVVNGGDERGLGLQIYPVGHPGPGYSLGFNSAEQMIQGSLPEGNFTLQATTRGQGGSTGFLNFSVRGGPYVGPGVNLIPNTSLSVTVREEFKSGASVFGEDIPASDDGQPNGAPQRRVNVQVLLTSVEAFGSQGTAVSQPVSGTQEHTLLLQDVAPGRYRVRVQSGVGYAASIVYGGTDLSRQPLVVGLGGSSAPIEVTLRDDGAEVDGKVEEGTPCCVYFLPVGEGSGQFREVGSTPDGAFGVNQLPPGTYRVLAFDRQQEDFAYNDVEAMRKLESKGEVIHVEAGQKEHLRLKVIPGGEPQ